MSLFNPCSGQCRGRPEHCPSDCILFTQNGGAVVNRGTGLHTTCEEAEPELNLHGAITFAAVRLAYIALGVAVAIAAFCAGYFA